MAEGLVLCSFNPCGQMSWGLTYASYKHFKWYTIPGIQHWPTRGSGGGSGLQGKIVFFMLERLYRLFSHQCCSLSSEFLAVFVLPKNDCRKTNIYGTKNSVSVFSRPCLSVFSVFCNSLFLAVIDTLQVFLNIGEKKNLLNFIGPSNFLAISHHHKKWKRTLGNPKKMYRIYMREGG